MESHVLNTATKCRNKTEHQILHVDQTESGGGWILKIIFPCLQTFQE